MYGTSVFRSDGLLAIKYLKMKLSFLVRQCHSATSPVTFKKNVDCVVSLNLTKVIVVYTNVHENTLTR